MSPPPGSNLSDKDLRRIHPKKRYRVLSKDETHNLDLIAEVIILFHAQNPSVLAYMITFKPDPLLAGVFRVDVLYADMQVLSTRNANLNSMFF